MKFLLCLITVALTLLAPNTCAQTAQSYKGDDLHEYYVQHGAFTREEDAMALTERIRLYSVNTRVSTRESGGRLVYRVRQGPFNTHAEAAAAQGQAVTLWAIDSQIVRVEKPQPPSQRSSDDERGRGASTRLD